MIKCSDDGSQQMAEASSWIYICNLSASRVGDRTTCNARVITASDNVRIGSEPEQMLPVQSEVPTWQNNVSALTLFRRSYRRLRRCCR
jgi:hypothetical protein